MARVVSRPFGPTGRSPERSSRQPGWPIRLDGCGLRGFASPPFDGFAVCQEHCLAESGIAARCVSLDSYLGIAPTGYRPLRRSRARQEGAILAPRVRSLPRAYQDVLVMTAGFR